MSGNHENNLSKEMLDISSRDPQDVDVLARSLRTGTKNLAENGDDVDVPRRPDQFQNNFEFGEFGIKESAFYGNRFF